MKATAQIRAAQERLAYSVASADRIPLMSRPEFFVTRVRRKQLRDFDYSQAVRVGNRVETSGQGGWDDDWNLPEALKDETAQAFDNRAHASPWQARRGGT